jgi:hypothetical protein
MRFQVLMAVSVKMTALMTEAVCTSETLVFSETTQRYIPEGFNLDCKCQYCPTLRNKYHGLMKLDTNAKPWML